MGFVENATEMTDLSISIVVDWFHFVLDAAIWTQEYGNDMGKVFVSIWILVL